MSQRDPSTILLQMSDHLEAIVDLATGRDRNDLIRDRALQYALAFAFVGLGALARRLPGELKDRESTVPWDMLAHVSDDLTSNYDDIDLAALWDFAATDAPHLASKLRTMAATPAPKASASSSPARVTHLPIAIPHARLDGFCRRNRIQRLSLFGSVVREDFGPNSDLDILVEFEPGYRPGLAYFGMADELAEILGRPVDLVTVQFLNRHIRERALAEAWPIYDAA